jgi:hypothetical protein
MKGVAYEAIPALDVLIKVRQGSFMEKAKLSAEGVFSLSFQDLEEK